MSGAVALTVAALATMPVAASPSPNGRRAPQLLAATTSQSVDGIVAQARARYRAYDYEGALALIEAALATEPLHLDANSLLLSIYSRRGDYRSLESRYRDLVAAYPDSAAAYYFLGLTAASPDAQQAYLRLATRIDSSFAPAVTTLAMRGFDPTSADEALELANRALATNPGDYRTVSGYAALLERLGREQEAIGLLQLTAAQYPAELRFWTRLWTTQFRAMGRDRNLERILPQINAQRHRFMDSLEHMEMLADVLSLGGTEASEPVIDLWLEIAERYPEHPRAELALFRALNETTGVDDKRRILETLVDRYPSSAARYAAYYDIINRLIRQERYEEAIDLSKSLLTLPDPPSDPRGVAREPRITSYSLFGTSLECLGYAGWFGAAQAPHAKSAHLYIDWTGRTMLRELDMQTVVTPQAAAAAQGLATSGCETANVLVTVGQYLAYSGTYRSLGIEILERAIEIHRNAEPGEFGRNVPLEIVGGIDRFRELLPYLYLQEGRLEDALAAVEQVAAETTRRSTRFYRIAGEVYELAGRLEDAERAYVRALSSGTDSEFALAALDRIYRSRSDTRIVTFAAADAPRVPLAGTRVRRVHLGIDAPISRFLGDQLTLVLLWSPSMPASHDQATALVELISPDLEALGIAALPIAVAPNVSSGVRRVQRSPFGPPERLGVVIDDDTFAEWPIHELPTTLLLDAAGRVRARQMSYGVAPEEWSENWAATMLRIAREKASR